MDYEVEIVIKGKVGSGKTTIANHIKYFLEKHCQSVVHISEGHIINGVLNGIEYYSKLKEKLDHNYFDCNPNIVNIIVEQDGREDKINA